MRSVIRGITMTKIKKLTVGFALLASILVVSARPIGSGADWVSTYTTLTKALGNVVIPEARAAGEFNQLANVLRLLFFMIVGFPDTATYNEIVSNGDGPPQSGMIGMVYTIGGHIAKAANVSSCADLPSSGSFTVADSDRGVSLVGTFAAPDLTIPTGYTDAGTTYEKRFTIAVNGANVFQLQFDCAKTRGIAYFAMTESGSYTRRISLVYELVNNVPRADFYMSYDGSDERMNLRLIGDSATAGNYRIDMVRAAKADSGSGVSGYRMHALGNATSKKATVALQGLSVSTMAALAAASRATSTGLTTDNSGGNSDFTYLFCLDFATLNNSALGACSGLALSQPSAPHFGASDKAWTIAYNAGSTFSSGLATFMSTLSWE